MYSEVLLEISNSTALCDAAKQAASLAEVTVLNVSNAAVFSTSLIPAIEEGLRQNPGQRKRFALVEGRFRNGVGGWRRGRQGEYCDRRATWQASGEYSAGWCRVTYAVGHDRRRRYGGGNDRAVCTCRCETFSQRARGRAAKDQRWPRRSYGAVAAGPCTLALVAR